MVDNQVQYVIPKFQREYTWSRENWEELISDIVESEGSHFIGSIICINQGSDSLSPELEVIDGQQRLTTLSLLFCAIYKSLKDKGPEDDDDFKLDLGNLKWKLVQRINGKLKLNLSKQNNNINDYKSVLSEIGVLDFDEHENNKGNRRIFKCYRYFLNRLDEYDVSKLVALLDKINRTLLVKIEVDSHSDAFMLFESLNNRGIPLSAIDLIKNKILAELESKDIMSADDAFEKWNVLINNLSDYAVQERFLRQYYNAFKYDPNVRVETISKATRSTLIKIYEKLIEQDPEKIFSELVKKSKIYHDFLVPEELNNIVPDELDKELIDLQSVQAAPAYTLLLYLFSLDEPQSIDFYRKVIVLLSKYFIRRSVTDFPNTRNLDKIFIELIEELEEDRSNITYDYIYSFLSDASRVSSLRLFKEKLQGDIYDLNVDATRYILSKIEETKKTDEVHLDFWARDKSKKLIWTIEHIFPEGENIPKDWVEMIAKGDIELAKSVQDEYVHKLGNLTLSGYNSNLSNLSFEKKMNRKDRKDNYIGYRNNLFLNSDVVKKNQWTKNDIVERTEKLIDLALTIFKFDDEKLI